MVPPLLEFEHKKIQDSHRIDLIKLLKDLDKGEVLFLTDRVDPVESSVKLTPGAQRILISGGLAHANCNITLDPQLDNAVSEDASDNDSLANLLYELANYQNDRNTFCTQDDPDEDEIKMWKLGCLIRHIRESLQLSESFQSLLKDHDLLDVEIRILACLFKNTLCNRNLGRDDVSMTVSMHSKEFLEVYRILLSTPLFDLGVIEETLMGLKIPLHLAESVLQEGSFRHKDQDVPKSCPAIKRGKTALKVLLQIDLSERTLPDLVLPPQQQAVIEQLIFASSNNGRSRLTHFGIKNQGITALFFGPSGTGKTLSALTVARKLDLPLYSVDCARIKDRFYGEAEQNSRLLFEEYRRLSKDLGIKPILLCNEADQILATRFTRPERSVEQADNSIQNIMLEELERFDGVLIATTNLATNLDKALLRRFLFQVEFPRPNPDQRLAILNSNLEGVPVAETVDLKRLAVRFPLTGGEIENAVRAAAIVAATTGCEILTENLLVASMMEQRRAAWGEEARIGFLA